MERIHNYVEITSANEGDEMSEAKHTPGPWVAGRPDMAIIESRCGKYIYAGEKYIAACGFDVDDWQEVMANARLIAAAPELLEACIAAKKLLEPDLVEPGRTVFWRLVDAITKAEGKQ